MACRRSLDGLGRYGSQTQINCIDDAAFGLNLFPLLPEDRFASQPYANERFMIVADIRLDNRSDLSSALGLTPSDGSACCDAKLLFMAWQRWQAGCLDRIVGDYALAVYEKEAKRLTLARDPIGQRPLFYAQIGHALFFASMPSGILPHGRFRHDPIRIAQRLAACEDGSSRSYFAGINQLLSGERIVISGDRSKPADGRQILRSWADDPRSPGCGSFARTSTSPSRRVYDGLAGQSRRI